ncbi:probable aldo-keto reductase 1 [Argentina anserina]|uniref:probable aldo-keto reductase 1 n=1 Tax=Argentina anserina TaxID=57926 RepID=UPI0021763493|nr:probable aldo-keto reductase 1 [Potentilla anserina]
MAEYEGVQIPKVQLGSQGFEVSKLGFGCRRLTGTYNESLVSEEFANSIIKHAFDNGITFFDTADLYGPHTNEILVGKALKQLPRDKIQLATKFGIVRIEPDHTRIINGTPEYVRACCEASLKRLDVDYIDLYYQHRVDTSIPIEDTIGELKKLVEEGKIKYIGLSEASPETIRRAHTVHPITAIQMEWSVWTREIEEEFVPLCRELGIGIVSYHPLGRGFLATDGLPEDHFLRSTPRCQGDNLKKNMILQGKVLNLAEKYGCTPAELALAWIVHQPDVWSVPGVVPIFGTTKTKHIDDNIGSLRVKLSREKLQEISEVIPINAAEGYRVPDYIIPCTWKNSDTPPKASEQCNQKKQT